MAMAVVPERMYLSDTMKNTKEWLTKAQLIPLDFTKPSFIDGEDSIVTEENIMLKGNEVVERNSGKYGSIAFVVRRPG